MIIDKTLFPHNLLLINKFQDFIKLLQMAQLSKIVQLGRVPCDIPIFGNNF